MDDSVSAACTETEVVVNTALVARIEALEAEARGLRSKHNTKSVQFRLENITHSDSLVRFYTGFQSYEILVAFFEFLGPSVNKLRYWGSKNNVSGKRRRMKLESTLYDSDETSTKPS